MSNNNAIQSTIENLNQGWDAAFNSKQPALVASFYDDEASLLPPGSAQITGGKAIHEFWRNLISQGFTEHRIELLETGVDQNLAYQRGRWSAAHVDAQGQRQEYGGNLHLLYRRQADGQWKAYAHTWN